MPSVPGMHRSVQRVHVRFKDQLIVNECFHADNGQRSAVGRRMYFDGPGTVIGVRVRVRRADAHSGMVGKSAGIFCGGVQENQEFVVVVNSGKVGASVAVEICHGYGLRSRAIRNVKINRLAPAFTLRREKSKNRITGGRRGRKWRKNAANFIMLSLGIVISSPVFIMSRLGMDGSGFLSCRCIKTIGQEYLAPELSRTNIGEGNHAGTLIRAAKKWDHQIVSLIAVEIHGLCELQCGVQGKQVRGG